MLRMKGSYAVFRNAQQNSYSASRATVALGLIHWGQAKRARHNKVAITVQARNCKTSSLLSVARKVRCSLSRSLPHGRLRAKTKAALGQKYLLRVTFPLDPRSCSIRHRP